jgi:uncharacterized protein YciI
MMKKAPKKLFICHVKTNKEKKEAIARVHEEHNRYMTDLWRRGIFWAGGPTDAKYSIQIYAVDSLEEAMQAQRNAPYYRVGFEYGDEYVEWRPVHWPPLRPDIDPDSGKRTDL